ncbi:hypothetical protein [Kitasatospora cinereorecta]|uniref:Uncharacterized protein n=1 Tax=Kitasatospora cinereorecta TaxID=285560 RepID=A0ABW0VGE3_9ACTN
MCCGCSGTRSGGSWGQFVHVGALQHEEDYAVRIALTLAPGPADTDALEAYAQFLRTELGLPDAHLDDYVDVYIRP